MHVPTKNPSSKFLRRRPSHQRPPSPSDVAPDNDLPSSPASTTEPPSSVLSPVDSERHEIGEHHEDEDGDAAGVSSESEYLLSDPTGYRTHGEFSPDKKVQFIQGKENTADGDEDKKDKKKKR